VVTIRGVGYPLPRVKVGEIGKGNARLMPVRLLDLRAGVSHKQEVGKERFGKCQCDCGVVRESLNPRIQPVYTDIIV